MPEINLGLQDLVDKAKSSLSLWAVNSVMATLAIEQPWTNLPVIHFFVQFAVTRIVDLLVQKGELGAFIINSKVLTSAQAADYRNAVAKVLTTPSLDTEAWKKAEEETNAAFDKLIRFSS